MIRVLIVDDELIMRQGLKYMIDWQQEGYEIVGEAANGNEALKMVETLEPQIIICDVVMPLMNGVDFSEAVGRLYPQIPVIILSGYDKFEYVKQTLINGVVDYLLKPTLNPTELLGVLEKASLRIPGYQQVRNTGNVSRERVLERYLLGHDKELDKAVFRECFQDSCYRLYAVNVKMQKEGGRDISDLLYKKVERRLKESAPCESILLFLREEICLVLFNYALAKEKAVLEWMEEVTQELAMLRATVLGICSRGFSSLENILAIYQQDVAQYIDKAFYYKGRDLLYVEEEECLQRGASKRFDFTGYNQLLGRKQFAEAVKLLEQYHEDSLKAQVGIYGLKNQMKNMIYHFMDFLEMEDEKREDYCFSCFEKINRAEYEEDYREVIAQTMRDLLAFSDQKHLSGEDRIQKMLAYIAENYSEDLTLATLAEVFNFNYYYLSAYFSQQMKEGFNDYLNRIRVQQACALLEKTDQTIAEISGRVGYADHSYFCKVFKKLTGQTPSAYRRR